MPSGKSKTAQPEIQRPIPNVTLTSSLRGYTVHIGCTDIVFLDTPEERKELAKFMCDVIERTNTAEGNYYRKYDARNRLDDPMDIPTPPQPRLRGSRANGGSETAQTASVGRG